MGFEARVHGPAYYDEVWRVLAELGSHRSCRLGTRSNCLFNTLRRLLFDSSTSLSLFIFRPLPIANSRIARLRPNSLPAIIFQGRHVVSRAGNPLLAPPSPRNLPSHAHLIKHYTPPQPPPLPTLLSDPPRTGTPRSTVVAGEFECRQPVPLGFSN